MNAPPTHQIDPVVKAGRDFNAFLNAGVQHGSLSVEHIRVRVRQPENEVFVRKALVAVQRLAPSTDVSVSVRETKASPVSGSVGLAEATAMCLEARPALAKYLGKPATGRVASKAPATPLDLFATLHALSQMDLARRYAVAPGFESGVFSVVGSLSGLQASASEAVSKAADSVFLASFADVYALSLVAAVDGADAALKTLNEVVSAREAGGDFSAFSLAPLSRDSRAALDVLRVMFTTGADFAAKGRQELLDHSVAVATEGLAAWMQQHGVDYQAATALVQGIESVAAIVGAASHRAVPQVKSHLRPA